MKVNELVKGDQVVVAQTYGTWTDWMMGQVTVVTKRQVQVSIGGRTPASFDRSWGFENSDWSHRHILPFSDTETQEKLARWTEVKAYRRMVSNMKNVEWQEVSKDKIERIQAILDEEAACI